MEATLTFQHLIHRWGCSVSEAILDSPCHYFTFSEIEGFIGYRLIHGCAVVLGDPVCSEVEKPILAQAFYNYCEERNFRVIYFITSEKFSRWAIQNICKVMLKVSEEIIFDPFCDPTAGHKGAKLRNAIHHAQHLGLVVKEYIEQDEELEKSILDVGRVWANARKGPQVYLGNLNFFENRFNHRWLYLEDGTKKIIGMALLSRLDAHRGWLLKFLITAPNPPRGASELLMISILKILRNEDCHFLTYSMIPAEHLSEIIGLTPFSAGIVKVIFKIAKWAFRLNQRKMYWKKFHPRMENSYLLFSSSKISRKELLALANTLKVDFK